MHRHGYKGRKLHREKDQRRSLIKSLAENLIEYGSIETTLAKAKEVLPYTEKLITRAKKGDLSSRRIAISELQTKEAANKLFDEITPRLGNRTSGFLRVETTRLRRGDNAQLARVSFVDDINPPSETKKPETAKTAEKKEAKTAKEAAK